MIKLFITFTFVLFSTQVATKENDLLNITTYKLTPEVKGVLLLEGNPISGVEIELTVGAMEKVRTHSTRTDDEGRFHFHELSEGKLLSPSIFDEQLVSVSIEAEYRGNSVKIWRTVTAGYDLKPFMLDNMPHLTCEIDSDLKYFVFSKDSNGNDDYEVHSICDLIGSIESGKY
ncbi:hypothetical protein VINI7043_12201 [Vibrio nigripulchritudo ATCC 27043]|uniref:DUF6795 domain-containing protein n=1 Tax=Vibrio nigripulchritudo SOn1 TaxID=1238450 RepID=A0AAV2VMI3_9VIBR|nr:carboxypeptidase-like regulatory domain-containing protein [Vibrio nigripulchritudo]EGU60737.1 hypothetical protein VINI7043_12201 [Vibrio nigripulchritudo ATCC 27043]CCO45853.1 conserved exported hypothetical protein [Vibrio nigripulchritudo SOn1]